MATSTNWTGRESRKSGERRQIKPRRNIPVQFSGGGADRASTFPRCGGFARKVGYNSVQAATNGIEFAKSKEFCKQALEDRHASAYLQFDGIGNDANSHHPGGRPS